MKKLLHILGWVADLAYGILLVTIGASLIVGGATGSLWLVL